MLYYFYLENFYLIGARNEHPEIAIFIQSNEIHTSRIYRNIDCLAPMTRPHFIIILFSFAILKMFCIGDCYFLKDHNSADI